MPAGIGYGKKAKKKITKVMKEFKKGELHSGSKSGPKVRNRKQAVAIAMSEAGMKKPHRGKVRAAARRAFGGRA